MHEVVPMRGRLTAVPPPGAPETGAELRPLTDDPSGRVGYPEWTLAVRAGNPAQRLYERLGFRRDDSLRDG